MATNLQVTRALSSAMLLFFLLRGNAASLAQSAPVDLATGYKEFYAGNLPEAARIAELSLRANPRSVQARILMARTRIVTGQIPRAYEELRGAYQMYPKNADVLYYLGVTANILAQGEYSRLFKIAPESGRAHQLMGEIYEAKKDMAKALEEYEAAVKVSPRLLEAWLDLGDLARSELNFEKAADSYRKVLELQPSNYDALLGLGACYQKQEPLRAIEFFQKAVEVAPSEAGGRLALGDVLLKSNQPAEALKQLQVAIRLDPEFRQAYVLVGRAQKALGQDALAAVSFQKARDIVETELETRRGKIRKALLEPPTPAQSQTTLGTGEPQK